MGYARFASPPHRGADPRLEHLIVATSALITELSLDGVLQRVVQVAAEVIGASTPPSACSAPDGRAARELHDHGINDESGPGSARCRGATASSAW